MGKRFTETNKWSDKWYRGLSPDFKLAWTYITDCCDQAGVIDIDRELANFQIGTAVDWDAFAEACEDRVIVTRRGKWFITGFIKFQYGKLSPDCKPHMPVIQLLEKHGIDAESVEQNQNFKYGNITPNRREKVFARDGHICCYCGEQFPPDGLEPDHVIPVSRGGNDAMGNLVAACVQCNRAKWDHHPTAFINALPDSDVVWQRLSQRVNERLYRSLKDKEEEKEKEKEEDEIVERGRGKPRPSNFDAWWMLVHYKTGKEAARRAYDGAVAKIRMVEPEKEPHAYLRERMVAFAKTPSANPTDRTPIHPATWLNKGCYADDPATWNQRGSPQGGRPGFNHTPQTSETNPHVTI